MMFQKGPLGEKAEEEWAQRLRRDGKVFFPTTSIPHNTALRGAPSMLDGGQAVALADFLVMGAQPRWDEVKGKTSPSWHRQLGRWEHGIDFAAWQNYEKLQERSTFPVMLPLYEKESPDCPECGGEMKPIAPSATAPLGSGGRCGQCKATTDRAVRPVGIWLFASVDDLRRLGQHRQLWSCGKGGGWLWPRNAMIRLDPPKDLSPHGQLALI